MGTGCLMFVRPTIAMAMEIPDDTIDISEGFSDCNQNGIIDICDVASGSFEDYNDNFVPDVCEPSDCNDNEIQDSCEIEQDPSLDVDGDGHLDECQSDCPADLG